MVPWAWALGGRWGALDPPSIGVGFHVLEVLDGSTTEHRRSDGPGYLGKVLLVGVVGSARRRSASCLNLGSQPDHDELLGRHTSSHERSSVVHRLPRPGCSGRRGKANSWIVWASSRSAHDRTTCTGTWRHVEARAALGSVVERRSEIESPLSHDHRQQCRASCHEAPSGSSHRSSLRAEKQVVVSVAVEPLVGLLDDVQARVREPLIRLFPIGVMVVPTGVITDILVVDGR